MEPNTQNALNPTPVTFSIPGDSGLFRATGNNGDSVYRIDPTTGQIVTYNILPSGAGNNYSQAISNFQSTYGVDYNSLPTYNLGDLYSQFSRKQLSPTQIQPIQNADGSVINWQTTGNLADLVKQVAPVSTSKPVTVNTPQPGTLGNTVVPQSQNTPNNGIPTVQPSTPNGSAMAQPNATPQTMNQATGTPTQNIPAQTYTIQAGDTLGKLAQTYGTTVGALMSLNPQITDANKIYTGQKLNLTAPQTAVQQTGGLKPTDQAPDAMVAEAQRIQAEIAKLTSPANTGTPTPPQTATGLTETTNIIDTWAKVTKELGLSDIKSQYDKTLDESKALQDKKNDEAADINNNPWYSEGKRQMELKKLDSKYETKLNTLSNYAKLYDSMYQEGLANARFLTTGIQDDQQFALSLAQKKQEAMDALGKDNQIISANGRELLVNKSTGKVIADLGASKVADSPNGGNLSNIQIDNGRAVQTSFENSPIVKNFVEIQSKYLNAQQYTGRGDGATDIAVIYDLMKVLDPTSVVRNEEYVTGANKSGNIFAGAMARFNGMIDPKGGFVSPQAKANIFQVIQDRYNTAKLQYNNLAAQKQAALDQVAPGMKLTDYAGTLEQQSSGGGSNFDYLMNDLTVNEATKKAYLPRSVWASVQDKDALLAEVMSEGYELLIND